jgi:hypothetical protein
MRLPCAGTQADALNPLRIIVPTLRIDITALHTLRARFRPLLENLLRQYLPASVDIVVRWHAGAVASNGDEWALVLDEPAPARMGADRRIGYTRLGGTNDIVLQ